MYRVANLSYSDPGRSFSRFLQITTATEEWKIGGFKSDPTLAPMPCFTYDGAEPQIFGTWVEFEVCGQIEGPVGGNSCDLQRCLE